MVRAIDRFKGEAEDVEFPDWLFDEDDTWDEPPSDVRPASDEDEVLRRMSRR